MDIEDLWDSDEISGTYFSAAEQRPDYSKVVKLSQETLI